MLKKEEMSLARRIKIVDQGEVHHVLGMSVKQDCKSRTLYQSAKVTRGNSEEIQHAEMQTCFYTTGTDKKISTIIGG